MTLVLVEVPNEAAVQALQQQPNVRVVGVVAAPAVIHNDPTAAPRQWAGTIPASSAEAWDEHLLKIREEWERDI